MKQFKNVATINAPRSKHNLSYSVKTSCNTSELVPIYLQEIYPGDTFNLKTSFVSRLTSAYIRPVMDNLFVDFYYFFVPSRLCFDKWEQIFGENRSSAWAQPQPVSAPVAGMVMENTEKTVADYLGLPLGKIPSGVNILPFRAFAKIYDDWFRDENLQNPMFINTGDWTADEVINTGEWAPNNYMGKLPRVSKLHDVFTSALPNTQKADSPVMIPIGDYAPIVAQGSITQLGDSLKMFNNNSSAQTLGLNSTTTGNSNVVVGRTLSNPTAGNAITGTNLKADLGEASILSVPDLRFAFQVQRILERSARTGSRYVEYLLGAFGVQSPDARLQRAEYLGGHRQPLSTQQVAQTTQGEIGELGSLGAFSLSNGQCGYSKGFVEHGFVIGVMCIRQKHTYQQGIEKFWQRSDRFSYYDPALAHISEQPIYKSELYAKAYEKLDDEVFGFQEAWYDLRNRNSHITGQMRSDAGDGTDSLDIWHFGDDYASAPFLNSTFIKETPEYVDRTIAVPSSSLDQFIFDIYHDQTAIRRIPAYSIPGLIDHY